MIDTQDILTWAETVLDQSDDGFKAEIVFLCSTAKISTWDTLTKVKFRTPMWETFAHQLYPRVFEDCWRYTGPNPSEYDDVQAQAVHAFILDQDMPVILGDEDHNTACHKVIWANRFGQRYGRLQEAQPIVDRGFEDSATNNERAMSCLSYALMLKGFDKRPLYRILSQDRVETHNYHEMLAALLALKLERTLG